jgi:D-alanine-D-alanine ligase-like ATP-grasp enzyme
MGLCKKGSSVNSEIPWDSVQTHWRLKVHLRVPEGLDLADWHQWGEVLAAQGAGRVEGPVPAELAQLSAEHQAFIAAFLRVTRWFMALARLPVFSELRVDSVVSKTDEDGGHVLEFELPAVDFIPKQVYDKLARVARDVCLWMARHEPSAVHTRQVFDAIHQHVVKAFAAVVPAGKSTLPVLKVAHEMGIPYMHLGLGIYQLGWGAKARRMDRSTTDLDSAMGSKLTQNKVATANLLRSAGLPAPTHGVVVKVSDALTLAAQLKFPLVVKPLDRERGEGVTVGIEDVAALKQAYAQAQELSHAKKVIIEKQVTGVCHRLFMVGGRLLYAVKRLPMSVQGDGQSTVEQRVLHEVAAQSRRPPWLRSGIEVMDSLARETLERAGYKADSVPARGVWVPLRPIETTAWGGVDEDVSLTLHPDNIAVAADAARLFGLHVAGVDIISADITQPWHHNGAIINEVNFAPLLGGGEISRSHIPGFLSELMPGQGKIPVKVFTDLDEALQAQADQVQAGLQCFFTRSDETRAPSGQPLVMPLKTVQQRTKALLCRSDVEAIVIFQPDTRRPPKR